jgi:hypothetical protein
MLGEVLRQGQSRGAAVVERPVLHVDLSEVAQRFGDLDDPRSPVNRRHPLVSVVVIALMAVLGGADGPTAIAAWANLKKDFLLGVLPLPSGVPQKDVYRRVLALLNPQAFQAAFADWLAELQARAAAAVAGSDRDLLRPLLQVDGKTARRSHDRRKGLGALHPVSVWAGEYGLTLAQVAVDEKSNETRRSPNS